MKKNNFCNIEKKLDKLSFISKRLTKSLNKFENIWKNVNVIYYSHGSISIDLENFFQLFKKNVMFSSYQLGKLIKNVGGNDFLPRKLNLIKKLRDFLETLEAKALISAKQVEEILNKLKGATEESKKVG